MSSFSRRAILLAVGFLAGCTATPAQQSLACTPTDADALGPFYIAETPVVDDLNRHGKLGDPLLLTGRIISAADGRPAIAGARIEIWQTDGNGDYHPANNGSYADYDDEAIDLRGTVISDEDGRYSVKTLVPGGYLPRPRHFHYRVTAPDHAPLVTQLYITGDGLVRQPGGECRHAALESTVEGMRYQAPDIFLVTR